ncbi:MAG: glutathione S-transferase C-terminal domain-containing protein, partial [Polymorphobacter sp.]
DRIAAALVNLEHYRRDSDVFAVGDSFGIVDAALIPLFFFFDAFDKGMGTGALIAAHPRLAGWWARAKASDLGSRALAEQAAGMAAFVAAARG